MAQRTSIVVVGRRALAVVILAGALVASAGRPALADSGASAPNAALVGVWGVEVTRRNCATDAPLGPPFNSLVTFHRGGTLSETAGGLAFAIGQRSPGTGIWTRQRPRVYLQRMVALILFDTPPNLPVSPGFFAGWQTVTHTVELSDADHFTSDGTNEFYKLNGEVYRTGCATAIGPELIALKGFEEEPVLRLEKVNETLTGTWAAAAQTTAMTALSRR